jgi:hypothetical protein
MRLGQLRIQSNRNQVESVEVYVNSLSKISTTCAPHSTFHPARFLPVSKLPPNYIPVHPKLRTCQKTND